MKLSASAIDYIQNVVKVCRVLGIENIVIEQNYVGGMDPARTVTIVHNENIPSLSFKSIGLTRLSTLQTRLDLIRQYEDHSIDATLKEGTDFIFSLTLAAKGVKVGYRCADPLRIEAKRSTNFVSNFRLTLSDHIIDMLKKGASAMSANKVTFLSNKDDVTFEFADDSNDIFSQSFSQELQVLTPEISTIFAYKYPIKLILSVFKDNPENTFDIGTNGVLKLSVGGITTYILPLME